MTYKENIAKLTTSQTEEKQIEQTRHRSRMDRRKHEGTSEGSKNNNQRRFRGVFSKYRSRVRLVPIWARLLITLVLFVFSLVAGLLVGYALVGEGDSLHILTLDIWQGLYEFINGD